MRGSSLRVEDGLRDFVARNQDLTNVIKLSHVERRDEDKVITLDDVVDERGYWSNALIGYVLGDRVPYSAMSGFIQAQWNHAFRPRCIFMTRGILSLDLIRSRIRCRSCRGLGSFLRNLLF